jgi:hypothetical protein
MKFKYTACAASIAATAFSVAQAQDMGTAAYLDEAGAIASVTARDRFGAPSELAWLERREADGPLFLSEWHSAGRGVVDGAFLDAARETAVASPGIQDGPDWLSDLAVGSIGNTAEERLDPSSPLVTASQLSWWHQEKEDKGSVFGMRPFSAHPYAYESSAIKNASGKLILLEDFRLRYIPPDRLKIEEKLIVPLTSSWQFNAGLSAYAVPGRGGDSCPVCSFGLNRAFWSERSLSFGCTLDRENGASVVMEFSIPWH